MNFCHSDRSGHMQRKSWLLAQEQAHTDANFDTQKFSSSPLIKYHIRNYSPSLFILKSHILHILSLHSCKTLSTVYCMPENLNTKVWLKTASQGCRTVFLKHPDQSPVSLLESLPKERLKVCNMNWDSDLDQIQEAKSLQSACNSLEHLCPTLFWSCWQLSPSWRMSKLHWRSPQRSS